MLISTSGMHPQFTLHTLFTYLHSAGELNSDELERIVTIIQNPTQFKIPTWFLNRQKDIVDGKNSQILSNSVDSKLRDDLERLKKIRAHRGLRHFWGLRVRGQHTKTTGELLVFARYHPILNVMQAVAGRLWVCRRNVARWITLHYPHVLCIVVHFQYDANTPYHPFSGLILFGS